MSDTILHKNNSRHRGKFKGFTMFKFTYKLTGV